ncbi:MAG TPA: hypothetical protein VEQ63_08860, partial [Bryobacteraceae bacterium]|nr:hypothetical protein [Bryobacteraceae bacterium]
PQFAPPPAAPPPTEPGEFTRMFQAPAAPPQVPLQGAHPHQQFQPLAPAHVPPAQSQPGEFTRMFQAPNITPTGSPQQTQFAPSPPPSSGPGEFTRYFEPPAHPQGSVAHPAYQNPLGTGSAPPAPANAPGEFTRMFGIPPASPPIGGSLAPMPPPPPAQGTAGEFTRMFQAPTQQPSAPVAPPASVPTPSLLTSKQPEAQLRRPAKQRNLIPLLIVLGMLFLLAIALTLFFALRK